MVYMSMRSPLLPFAIIIALALAPSSHGLSQSSSLASTSATLNYHGGPLLSNPASINIYLVWYGNFPPQDMAPIHDFFASLISSPGQQNPTVAGWWSTILAYKDKAGKPVSGRVRVAAFHEDKTCSLGKNIKRPQIANYVKKMIDTKVFPLDTTGVYLFLTAKDILVERFCLGSCGFHESMAVSPMGRRVVYAHVGDPEIQCPGLCAWPYAVPAYGPPGKPLVSPNGVGIDGMIMNIATILPGAATNPFKTGYFQGNALAPLEAVTACPGIFGPGAYPGYPGELMVDKLSKASYNAYGANGKKFLLPAIWDLKGSTCKVLA